MLPLDWQYFPGYFAIVTMVVLAALLLVLDFQRRAYRAFALFLIARASALTIGLLRMGSESAAQLEFWQRFVPYALIPTLPLLVYFLSVYPRPRGILGKNRHGGWITLGFIVAMESLYFLNHDLFWTFAAGGQAGDYAVAFIGYEYTHFGPLVLLHSLLYPGIAYAAYRLIQDARLEPLGTARYSLLLIAAGLALSNLFYTGVLLFDLPSVFAAGQAFPWWPFGWAYAFLPSLGFFATLVCFIPTIQAARDHNDHMLHAESVRLLWVLPLPIICAILLRVAGNTFTIFENPIALFVLGVWRSALPVLACYGLVRYQLFDIDARVQASIRHGSVVAAFALVFFAVGETVEAFVGDRWGTPMALSAAALMTFAIRPLERIGHEVATRLMPATKSVKEMTSHERRQLYDAQFALAVQDGGLTASERQMLRKLQARLGVANVIPRARPRNPRNVRG